MTKPENRKAHLEKENSWRLKHEERMGKILQVVEILREVKVEANHVETLEILETAGKILLPFHHIRISSKAFYSRQSS